MKTSKLSKVEIECQKRQINQHYFDSVEDEAGELDAAEEEVVTQSADYIFR